MVSPCFTPGWYCWRASPPVLSPTRGFEGYNDNKDEFYLLVLIAALGGILLANANHLASLFLGIELISLPLFGTVGYAFRQKRSLEASIKYTILSAAASSFLLFGMALVYAQSGDLSFVALGKTSATVCSTSRCCWQVSD